MTGIISLAIGCVQLSIFDCDVRRIPHHDMVLLSQDALQLLRLLQRVDGRCPALLNREPRLMRYALARTRPAVAVQQAIANRDIDGPAWRVSEPMDAAGVQRSDDEAEAGDG